MAQREDRTRKSTDRRKDKEPIPAAAVDVENLKIRVVWKHRMDDTDFALPLSWRDIPPKDLTTCDAYYRRPLTEEWDAYDALFYNGLKRMKIVPTKFICPQTLSRMGFTTQINEMLRRVGLGSMAAKNQDLYPELVRQFLASCQLRFKNERKKIASEGELTFKLDGVFHVLTLKDICKIYHFDETNERVSLPATFPLASRLWSNIARFNYNSKKSVQTEIRNPVLRVFLKIVGNTILCKGELSRMRVHELLFLHYAIGHSFDYSEEFPASHNINMGAVFASQLVDCKTKSVSGIGKSESIGSLLTPIFRFVRAQLDRDRLLPPRAHLDETYFINTGILSKGWKYNCHTNDGIIRKIQLPCDLADISTVDALRFEPEEGDFTSTHVQRPVRHAAETSASGSQSLPPPPPADSTDEAAKWKYVFDSLAKIWGAIAAIPRCQCTQDDAMHPPPQRRDRDPDTGTSDARHARTRSTSPSDHADL